VEAEAIDRTTRVVVHVLLAATLGIVVAALLDVVEGPWWDGAAVASITAVAALAWERERRGWSPVPSVRVATLLAVVVLVVGTFGPVVRSTDLWAYATYGRIVVVHHENPYVATADRFPDDPMQQRMSRDWVDTPAVYGPVFVGATAAVALVAGTSPTGFSIGLKGLTAAGMGGVLLLLRRARTHPAVIAFVFLHPAIAVYQVGGGHADGLAAVGVLAGVLLVGRRRVVVGALCLAAAACVKVTGAFVALPLVLWLWHRPERSGRRDATVFAAVVGGVTIAAYLATGTAVFSALQSQSQLTTWTTFWRQIGTDYGTGPMDAGVTRIASASVVAAMGAIGWRHRRAADPEVACAYAVLAYLTLTSYSLVWYLAWILPVVALRWRSAAGVIGAAVAALFAIGPLSTPRWMAVLAVATLVAGLRKGPADPDRPVQPCVAEPARTPAGAPSGPDSR
jgi:hypothetical protein